MNDQHHTWNDGKPIRTKKQPCGCYIGAKTLILCERGQDLKKSADSWYKLWRSQKETPIDPVIIRTHLASFEIHKKAYLKHIMTGKEWVI